MNDALTAQLTQLQHQLSSDKLSAADAMQAVLRCCLDALHIQRAALWLFSADDLMSCQMLLDKTQGVSRDELMIDRWSFPAYFAALDSNQVIRAADAFSHPATAELREHFLRPLNIRSLLDVPIKQHDKVVGIICCEQTDVIKHWSVEEVQFVIALCELYSSSINRPQ
ncbi:MAG: GAF domain-containing protein [Rheinheimera sp.]|nr:GAF domain-containing protein [Rheinheimera sp.]